MISINYMTFPMLKQYIQTYFGIPNQSLEIVANLFEEENLLKDAFFAKAGQYCQKLSFIKTGYLRVYLETERKEVTQWISGSSYFAADLRSLIFNLPTRWNIQAITDCQLFTISSENYRKINQLVPEWDSLEKKFIAKCFITLEERVFSFLSMTAEERYLALHQQDAQLFNQVPLHYLASMLGMTPETLSRIRKKRTS
ncbi:MAG: cyclic nucleotide-binding protein [Bacteroidota bacterium]